MGKNRVTLWCKLAIAGLLLGAQLAQAAPVGPPIKIALLYGGRPTPSMFDPMRKAIAAIDPVLAERLVVSMVSADLALNQFEPLAATLLSQRPVLALAYDLSSAQALAKMRGKGTTPIVFRAHSDPLGSGLIASYARPGRNMTGFTTYRCLDDKLIEILLDAFPAARRVGFFSEPATEDWGCHQRAVDFAATRGITLIDFKLATSNDVAPAIESLGRARLDAMVVPAVVSTWSKRRSIVAAMDSLGLPAIYEAQSFTDAGGLMHFGSLNAQDANTLMAQLVVKVLKGEHAGDIPVSQPTRFELVINLKAANAKRYNINPRLLRRADRIIE
jgi:putative ABC transport system substrate-binding protein